MSSSCKTSQHKQPVFLTAEPALLSSKWVIYMKKVCNNNNAFGPGGTVTCIVRIMVQEGLQRRGEP